ncbi:hypothetical protein CWI39_2680p0020, partial [Hamiltosporidium magnivora]
DGNNYKGVSNSTNKDLNNSSNKDLNLSTNKDLNNSTNKDLNLSTNKHLNLNTNKDLNNNSNDSLFNVLLLRAQQFEREGKKRKAITEYKTLLKMYDITGKEDLLNIKEKIKSLSNKGGSNYRGVSYSSSKQQGVSYSSSKQQGVNNSTCEQQGVNNSINEQQGVNTNTNQQHPLNNNTNIHPVIHSKEEILKILNSGSYIEIKKIKGIGDKRAEIIINFLLGGNRFYCIEDLRMLFTEKIYNSIIKGC